MQQTMNNHNKIDYLVKDYSKDIDLQAIFKHFIHQHLKIIKLKQSVKDESMWKHYQTRSQLIKQISFISFSQPKDYSKTFQKTMYNSLQQGGAKQNEEKDVIIFKNKMKDYLAQQINTQRQFSKEQIDNLQNNIKSVLDAHGVQKRSYLKIFQSMPKIILLHQLYFRDLLLTPNIAVKIKDYTEEYQFLSANYEEENKNINLILPTLAQDVLKKLLIIPQFMNAYLKIQDSLKQQQRYLHESSSLVKVEFEQSNIQDINQNNMQIQRSDYTKIQNILNDL